MGATDFEVFVSADEASNAGEAFDFAHKRALYEYGSAGYTGTIAEKYNFFMASNKPVSQLEANELVNAVTRGDVQNDKWGPACCVEVVDVEVKKRTITRTLSLDHEKTYRDDLIPELGLKDGEYVTEFEILEDNRKYVTKTKRHTGKAKRVFRVGSSEFATLKEAIDSAKAFQEKKTNDVRWSGATASVDIVEIVRRGDSNAATVSTELKSRRVKVKVEISTPTGKQGKKLGWLFYGLASC